MLLVEGMGLVDMFTLDEPVRALQQAQPDQPADPVVGVVTAERSQHQQRREPFQPQRAQTAQRTRHKQQRIAGQERRHHQAGFAIDDQEQDGIYPHTILPGECQQVGVQMQDDVDEGGEQVHELRQDFLGLGLLRLDEIFARHAEQHQQRAGHQHRGIDTEQYPNR